MTGKLIPELGDFLSEYVGPVSQTGRVTKAVWETALTICDSLLLWCAFPDYTFLN